jgi:hypothetical protein
MGLLQRWSGNVQYIQHLWDQNVDRTNLPDIIMLYIMCILVSVVTLRSHLTIWLITWYNVLFFPPHFLSPLHHCLSNMVCVCVCVYIYIYFFNLKIHILLSISELFTYINLPCRQSLLINFCLMNSQNWCWVLPVDGIVRCNQHCKFTFDGAFWIIHLLLHL